MTAKVLDGYIRVSRVGGRDGDSFISPDVQRARILQWAEQRGVEIAMWHEELDVSGGRMDGSARLQSRPRADPGRGYRRNRGGEERPLYAQPASRA